jgi:prepilin-type N-terminal cleavage/methylation domain-containing protein
MKLLYLHTRRRHTSEGLTLLELLTAILIASILSGTALLSYGRMLAGWRLNAAVRQVVMDLKVTRIRAIMENTGQRIRFEVPSSLYRRQRREASSAYADVGTPIALPDGIETVDCTARDDAVTFQPRGHASAFGTITLRNSEGKERRIVVDMAGRMRVER